jgi:tocopherol O-methyltransferase
MITPRAPLADGAVGRHYDDLDRFYREIWGEHLHHGLWTSGEETAAEAVLALAHLVAERAGARRGARICDVGCGYGGTARLLAEAYGAAVTGLTISRAQYDYAVHVDPLAHNPAYVLRDWLDNRLPAASFDAVIAIESTEHMADKARCVAEMGRVLRPGGRAVVCAWLAAERPTPWQVRHLLEPICREGRLPGLGSESEYRALFEQAGLVVEQAEDVSARVRRTWPACIRGLAAGLLREPAYRRFLLSRAHGDRVFALTMLRIWRAYGVGAMRYVVLTGVKGA